ncbi:MAG: hypothetical protein LQ342_007275 [Letrouitia transgressa]|nr:MAG: hypothetical protein LQ342_007275 [Letrouitia transgressa]
MAENLPFDPLVFGTSNDRPMPVAPPSTADLTSMPVLEQSQPDPQARQPPSIPLQSTSNRFSGMVRTITPITRRRGGAPFRNLEPANPDPNFVCERCRAQGWHTPNQPRTPVPVSAPEPAALDPNRQYQRRPQQTFPSESHPYRRTVGNVQERRQAVPERVSSEQSLKDRSDSDATVRPVTTPVIRVSTPGSAQSIRRFPILDVTTAIQAPPTAVTASPPSRLDGAEEEEYTAPSSTRKKTDEFCKSLKKIPSKLSLLWRPRSKANDNNEPQVAPESGSSVPKTKNPLWSMSSKRFNRGSRNQRTPLLSGHGRQNTNNYGSFDQTNNSSQQTTNPVSEPSSDSEQRPPPLPPRRPITPQPANPFDDSSGLETFGIHPQDPITQAELDEAERQAAVEESQRTLREARIQNLGLRGSEDSEREQS